MKKLHSQKTIIMKITLKEKKALATIGLIVIAIIEISLGVIAIIKGDGWGLLSLVAIFGGAIASCSLIEWVWDEDGSFFNFLNLDNDGFVDNQPW